MIDNGSQLLGIGAQKSATTWLYSCLEQHDEVRFPFGKEAHFWNGRRKEIDSSTYLSEMSAEGFVNGDITPAYSLLDQQKVNEIKYKMPDAMVVLIVRNPIERAWSSALMALGRAELEFSEVSETWFYDHFLSSGSRLRGDYPRIINNWKCVYGDQFHVITYDQIVSQPEHVYQIICRQLRIECKQEVIKNCRRPIFAGPAHEIPKRCRDLLHVLYKDGIERTSNVLEADLSHWTEKYK